MSKPTKNKGFNDFYTLDDILYELSDHEENIEDEI